MAYEVGREPGGFAKRRSASDLRVAKFFLILGAIVGLTALSLIVLGRVGLLSALALAAVALGVSRFFDFRLNDGVRWGKGATSEIAVGRALETLRREGYVVMHDLDRVVAGNIDHLVSGPTGVFMIETKFRRYEDRDLPKAKRIALQLARELDVPWVQPVVCFGTRAYGPKTVRGVAVMGRDQLLQYLRSQRNPVVPFERLAAFADRQ